MKYKITNSFFKWQKWRYW